MWWHHGHGLLRWKLTFPDARSADATDIRRFHFFVSYLNATDTTDSFPLCFHYRYIYNALVV